MSAARQLSSKDWFGKASAGVILGFGVALGASGLLTWLLGVQDTYFATKGQLAMWFMSPVWALVLSLCFFFSTGLRAWLWLGLANLVLWVPVFLWRMP